ncbi:MAG: hypothetical protein GXY77_14890 [Fibrobacter sp.]|nr:hypothetical protein [Fibrobacter sp.]
MDKTIHFFLLISFIPLLMFSTAFASDNNKRNINKNTVLKAQPYSVNRDIAFISIMGSRPSSRQLQGFQWAVLYNAQGRMVQKVNMKNDSIYSLDKMIQENKTKGPLLIKMFK